MKAVLTTIITLLVTNSAVALDNLGDPGWSGYLNLGLGFGGVKNNTLHSISGFDIELGSQRIDDFGSPSTESLVLPMVAAEVGYTFGNGKTRLLLGNDFRDYVQFDRSTLFALRHDFDEIGAIQFAFLSTPFLNTKAFSDPYQTDVKRKSTDYNEDGLRLTWDRMLGTGFELKVSMTEVDLDSEQSGQGMGLSLADQALLDRNGDVLNAELGYLFSLGKKHVLRPGIVYIDRDLDGEALASESIILQLSHLYSSPESGIRVVTNFGIGSFESDMQNPIFLDKMDGERYSLTSTAFFAGAFGLKGWVPNAGFFYSHADANIDFYESKLWGVSAGIIRRF